MGKRNNHRRRGLKARRKRKRKGIQFIPNSLLRTGRKKRGLFLLPFSIIKIWAKVSMSLLPLPKEDSQLNLIWVQVQTAQPNLFMIHPLSKRMILQTNLKKCPITHPVARKKRKRRRRSVGTAFYKNQSCMNWWNLTERYSLSLKKARPWRKKRAAVAETYNNNRALGVSTLEIIWLMWLWIQIIQ